MKILHRYVLKEHLGPLAFSLGALTSLLLLNTVAKRFGDLAGKGLAWSVIGEFFALAIPYIVAMTLPMAVLVATLYAFSRLASENEITAFKASGVALPGVMRPVLMAAALVTIAMILFNDQVLPRSNHRLSVLQRDIAQKKPTFALREQIINELSPGKLYLRAGHLDENSNRMREITIYDFADAGRRRTIIADSGNLAMSANQTDLVMTLYHGTMQDVPTSKPEQLQRLFFDVDVIRVRGVANQFSKTEAGTYKGEREMTVCEMAAAQNAARADYAVAHRELRERLAAARRTGVTPSKAVLSAPGSVREGPTLGQSYCAIIGKLSGLLRRNGGGGPREQERLPATQAPSLGRSRPGPTQLTPAPPAPAVSSQERAVLPALLESMRVRTQDARSRMDLYAVEIHKKFALAVACFVFVLLGAPIALRFPRGGVGLTIGVSIVVFGLYYVALIGGQSLGVRGVVPPALAMWIANLLFAAVAGFLLIRMGREDATSRGGDAREMLDALRSWIVRKLRRVGIRLERRRRYA